MPKNIYTYGSTRVDRLQNTHRPVADMTDNNLLHNVTFLKGKLNNSVGLSQWEKKIMADIQFEILRRGLIENIS